MSDATATASAPPLRAPYSEDEVKQWAYMFAVQVADFTQSAVLVDDEVTSGVGRPAATISVDVEAALAAMPETPVVVGASLADLDAEQRSEALGNRLERLVGRLTADVMGETPAEVHRQLAERQTKQLPPVEQALASLDQVEAKLNSDDVSPTEKVNLARRLRAVTQLLVRTPTELLSKSSIERVLAADATAAKSDEARAAADLASRAGATAAAGLTPPASSSPPPPNAEEAAAGAMTAALREQFLAVRKALEACRADLLDVATAKRALAHEYTFGLTRKARACIATAFGPFLTAKGRARASAHDAPLNMEFFLPDVMGEGRDPRDPAARRPAHYVPEHPDGKWPSLAARIRLGVAGDRSRVLRRDGSYAPRDAPESADDAKFRSAQAMCVALPCVVVRDIVVGQLSALKASFLETAYAEVGCDEEGARARAMFPSAAGAETKKKADDAADDWTVRFLRAAVVEVAVPFASVAGANDPDGRPYGELQFDLFMRIRPRTALGPEQARLLAEAPAARASYTRFVTRVLTAYKNDREERLGREAAEHERKRVAVAAAAAAAAPSQGAAAAEGEAKTESS